MIPHSAIAQQNTPYEQVAQVYGAFILGKCRHNSAEITAHFIHQRLDHRANITLGGRVESGAHLEVDLLDALPSQPAAGMQ